MFSAMKTNIVGLEMQFIEIKRMDSRACMIFVCYNETG